MPLPALTIEQRTAIRHLARSLGMRVCDAKSPINACPRRHEMRLKAYGPHGAIPIDPKITAHLASLGVTYEVYHRPIAVHRPAGGFGLRFRYEAVADIVWRSW